MRKLKNLFCILWVSFFSLVLFSCSTEEEESGVVSYTMGFDTVQSSDLSDLAVIESAYKAALGTNDNTFKMEGKVQDCDQKVLQTCQKVETKLDTCDWYGSYTFCIRNISTTQTIYSKTYEKKVP